MLLINWLSLSSCQAQGLGSCELQLEEQIFQSNTEAQQINLILKKANCLKQKNMFAEAYNNLLRIEFENLADTLQNKILFELMLNATMANQPNDAMYYLIQHKNFVTDSANSYQINLLKAIIYLENREWETAHQLMRSLLRENEKLKLDSIWNANFPRFKNVKKARRLSTFLPGLGQSYAGKAGFGIINFIGIAGSAYFTYWHIIHQYYWIAAITGGGWMSRFYVGGLKTSTSLTRKNNEQKAVIFQQKIGNWWLQNHITH
jgi:hypothetical protein